MINFPQHLNFFRSLSFPLPSPPSLPRPPRLAFSISVNGFYTFYSNFAAHGSKETVLSQILHGGPLAEARARRNLSAYQNEIKPGKINVSLSDPCILILSREKASFSLSARFPAPSLTLSPSLYKCCPFLSRSAPLYRPSISGRKRKTKQFARSDREARGPIIFRSADFARKNGRAITN